MGCKLLLVLVVLVVVFKDSNGARILGVVPMPSYSHQVVFHPIWRELSLRGHQVTVLTTHPLNDPSLTNLTEINLHDVYDVWVSNSSRIISSYKNSFFKFFHAFRELLIDVVDEELKHPQVKELISNKNEHFDLVMVEFFLPAVYAFSERFKCPYIGLTSLDASPLGHEMVGNPTNPAVFPNFLLPFNGKLNFVERTVSVLFDFYLKYYAYFYGSAQSDALVAKHFGENYPSISELQRRISMLFINVNPVLHDARPLGPTTVTIGGGIHIAPPKPLPKDIKTFLDEAQSGVIYFSLGSNVKSEYISEQTMKTILETFSELPYKILWKFEDDSLTKKISNIKNFKWLPQQDVLRHPNVKLFITQGGLQSVEEAMYNHVPMLALPFFADQDSNVKKMVSKGMGLALKHQILKKDEFKNTILEIINNPLYKNNARKLAQLANDEPMTGLERAVWWTEYLLRNKNVKHLRNPVLDMPLYQYLLLDVISFLFITITLLTLTSIKLFKFFLKSIVKFFSNKKLKVQ